jgi:Ca2+/Na+ antiporter
VIVQASRASLQFHTPMALLMYRLRTAITARSYTLIGAGMSEGLEGVTVLAWGAQVPDTLASVAMAKKGMGAVGLPR